MSNLQQIEIGAAVYNGSSVQFSKEASGKNRLKITLDVKPKEWKINILGTEKKKKKNTLRGGRAAAAYLHPSY